MRTIAGTSDLAVAGSTLAVAAAFGPVRTRVQRAVDQRFDRLRYDAARAIEGFSARLRDEVDIETVRRELASLITETMAPSQVGLWLREPGRPDAPYIRAE
jgi:hypothetical protein